MTSAVLWLFVGAAVCRVVENHRPRFARITASGMFLASFLAWLLDWSSAGEWWGTHPEFWRNDHSTAFHQGLMFAWIAGHLLISESFAEPRSPSESGTQPRWMLACGALLSLISARELVRFLVVADLLMFAGAKDLSLLFRESPRSSPRNPWWTWPMAISLLGWIGTVLVISISGQSSLPGIQHALLTASRPVSSWLMTGQVLILISLIARIFPWPMIRQIDEQLSAANLGILVKWTGGLACALLPFAAHFCRTVAFGAGPELTAICLISSVAMAGFAAANFPGHADLARSWLSVLTLNSAWSVLGWGLMTLIATESREAEALTKQMLHTVQLTTSLQVSATMFCSLAWLAILRHVLWNQRDRCLWADWAGFHKVSPGLGTLFCAGWFGQFGFPLTAGFWGRLGLIVHAGLMILPARESEIVGSTLFRCSLAGLCFAEMWLWSGTLRKLRLLILEEPLNSQFNKRITLSLILAVSLLAAIVAGGLMPNLWTHFGPGSPASNE